MTDNIAALQTAYREHLEYAAAIAETLAAIEQTPTARLRLACTVYDQGDDPDATALAEALAATIDWDNDP